MDLFLTVCFTLVVVCLTLTIVMGLLVCIVILWEIVRDS